MYVFPGGIDAHTHLDMPFGGTTSSDDFETGTIAAAHGGTTTIIDFAIQQKGGSLRAALDTWRGKAEGKAAIDYGFHMIATDVPPPALEEMGDSGLPAYAETCPQYLFFSEDDLRGKPGDEFEGAKFVCTPPLRPKHHHDHLWRGLRNYDLQVVSTDHCPFCMKEQKELGRSDFSRIPNGMPGIETRLYLLWEGVREKKISLNRFVEITATAPAKIFGLYPRKGTIAVGADADVVVWDPEKRFELSLENLHMRADYAPFEGKMVIGAPSQVLSRGE